MAFDLVARLRLQDDFSARMQSVTRQMDAARNMVNQVTNNLSNMGSQFNNAGSIATSAMDRVRNVTARMGQVVSRVGTSANNAFQALGNAAGSFQYAVFRAGQAAQNILGRVAQAGSRMRDGLVTAAIRVRDGFRNGIVRGAELARNALTRMRDLGRSALERLGQGAGTLWNKFKQAASRIRDSMRNGINNPAHSARDAILGIASAVGALAVLNKGFNMLKGSIEGAIARYDTLNKFPKVLEQIGFSTGEAKKSINELAKGIDGLPTTLNDVAATTQQIAVTTGDLDKATKTTIALNNALIASGSDAEEAARGTDQYLKTIATGKVEMDTWTTLQETMGLGLKRVAKAFGHTGPKATTELYNALKDGHVTFDQFNDKLIELNDGTNGFAEVAKVASGGIAVAWGNVKQAITNGVTASIEAIDKALGGTGKIEHATLKLKGVVNKAFKGMNAKLGSFVKKLKAVYEATKPFHQTFLKIAKGALVFGAALAGISTLAGVIATLGTVFSIMTAPIGLIVLGIAGIAAGLVLAYAKIKPFREGVNKIVGTFQALFDMVSGNTSNSVSIMKQMGFSDDQIQKMVDFSAKVIETFDMIKSALGQFKEYLAAKFAEMGPGLATYAEAFSIAKDTIVSVFQTLWAFLQPIFGAIGAGLSILGDVFVMVFNNVIAPLVKFTWALFQTLWAVISPILKLLGIAIGITFAVLKVVWDTILKPVAGFLMGEFKKALDDLMPILDGIKGAFDFLSEAIDGAFGWFKNFRDALSKFTAPKWLSRLGGGGTVKFESSEDSGESKGKGAYHGESFVPRDNKPYRLHRGEGVLTAKENKAYRSGKANNNPSVLVTGNSFHVRNDADIDAIANTIASRIIAAGGAGA